MPNWNAGLIGRSIGLLKSLRACLGARHLVPSLVPTGAPFELA